MEKKLIIAIGLSLMVLLTFQMLSPKQKPAVQQQAQVAAKTNLEQTTVRKEYLPEPGAGFKEEDLSKAPQTEKLVEIQTDAYKLTFSDIGGSLKKISLNEYQDQNEEEILVDEIIPAKRIFAMQSGQLTGLDRQRFELTRKENILEYRFKETGWIETTKRYTIYKSNDRIDLEIFVKNLSSRKTPFSYQIVGPSGLEQSGQIIGRSFLQVDTMLNGKIWKTKGGKSAQEKTGDISWVALKNRYFTIILKPFSFPRAVTVTATTNKNLLTALTSQSYELAPESTIEEKYLLYAGPLNEKRIAQLGYDMQQVVDYGFFGGVSKALLSVLSFFYKWTRNWGVAIILLTILINIILFPLTYKSFAAMQQMKKIQPHMQKLKDLHKDNPQKLNKEMMELYKQHNVNPLGGCLPLLLQMPIFIALYQGLMRSVALKGAKFLWIKDLAQPDAVAIPFSLPLIGAHINVLPLLMVGVMVLQQKVSQGISAAGMTDEQANQQRMMMIMMPLFFGFLFYKMPSGLVLYWLTNTILMTSEQTLISKRMNAS